MMILIITIAITIIQFNYYLRVYANVKAQKASYKVRTSKEKTKTHTNKLQKQGKWCGDDNDYSNHNVTDSFEHSNEHACSIKDR
jgi:predicted membrane protein